jgi:branched-chain amino acid aminotransferase
MSNKFDFSTKSPRNVWLNGKLVRWEEANIPVTAMGASGSLAVFEGIKAYWNKEKNNLYIIKMKAHMRRFYDSMKIVRMKPAYSQSELEAGVIELLQSNELKGDTYIRPVAFYDGIKLPSFRYTIGEPPDLLISTSGFYSHLMTNKGKKCTISSWTRISDNSQPPRVKCMSNYQNNRLAFMQASLDGYDDAFMLDDRGKLTEGTMSCLFMVRDGVLVTPPITNGILESITRSAVIQICRELLNLPTVEREIDRTELYIAEEAFLCGTGEEITSVISIDRIPVGSGEPGPIFKSIEEFYHDLVRGIDLRFEEWLTSVY